MRYIKKDQKFVLSDKSEVPLTAVLKHARYGMTNEEIAVLLLSTPIEFEAIATKHNLLPLVERARLVAKRKFMSRVFDLGVNQEDRAMLRLLASTRWSEKDETVFVAAAPSIEVLFRED